MRSLPGVSARTKALDVENIVTKVVFAVTIVVVFLPILFMLWGSFQSDSPGAAGSHFTFGNWQRVYGSSEFGIAFLNTLALATTVAVLSVALGMVLAWIVARTNAPGVRKLGPLLALPLMISTLVTTLAWIALAAPNAGFINAAANAMFGVKTVFDIYSFQGMVLVLVLHYASFAFISIYAALRSIDSSLEEASYMLGAGAVRTALRMTLPLIWPAIASTFLMIFIFVSENFAVPTQLGKNMRFETLMTAIYHAMTYEPSSPTLAATAGTMLLSIAIVGTLWQRRIIKQAGRYVTVGGKGGNHQVAQLGRWRYLASGIVAFYILASIVIPYLALIAGSLMKFVTPRITPSLFTFDHYTKLFATDVIRPIQNSLLLATIGAAVGTLFYILLGYLIKQSKGWSGRAMDYAVIVPTVTPALVLGVGFVWVYVGSPVAIYGTIWILFLGYIVRYLGQGVRQARSAFVQISGELPEAARMSGASPLRAFADILLPLMRPAMISIWTIMFIHFFMEISLTIILYTPQTITLPVLLWTRMQGGLITGAYAVAVIEATIIFIFLLVANALFGTLKNTLDR
jgi:iron(III) transport system permease protein